MDFEYSSVIYSDLGKIKGFVDEILIKIDNLIKDEDVLFDIKLILNELIINGIFHGNHCIGSLCVKLSLRLKGNKIIIQVEDEGKGIDFDLEAYDPTELSCCGRGLVLVNGLSDEFYIRKNKVIAVKHLH